MVGLETGGECGRGVGVVDREVLAGGGGAVESGPSPQAKSLLPVAWPYNNTPLALVAPMGHYGNWHPPRGTYGGGVCRGRSRNAD